MICRMDIAIAQQLRKQSGNDHFGPHVAIRSDHFSKNVAVLHFGESQVLAFPEVDKLRDALSIRERIIASRSI